MSKDREDTIISPAAEKLGLALEHEWNAAIDAQVLTNRDCHLIFCTFIESVGRWYRGSLPENFEGRIMRSELMKDVLESFGRGIGHQVLYKVVPGADPSRPSRERN